MSLAPSTRLGLPSLAMLAALAVNLAAPSARADEPKAEKGRPKPPNILMILADDLGYGDLGCFGQERIQTPNLDRMAREGMTLTDFYAGSTVCAPSRCVLMTGKHVGHAFIRGNARVSLPPEEVTVAELLRKAGYKNGLVGKWGLGAEGSDGVPTRQGFDSYFGYLDQHHAHNYYPAYLIRDEARQELPNVVPGGGEFGDGVATKKVVYSHDLMAAEALKFVGDHAKDRFFLYFALTIPHANNEGKNEGMEVPDLGIYKDKDWPEPQKAHAAMISRMDADLGRLFQKLKDLGIDEDTFILFSSDNGPHREGGNDPDFNDSNGPLRGIKRDLYEGGIRVPTIARWPGHIKAGSTSDHVGYFGDFLATAADLAGIETPPGLDSISIVPTLLGRPQDQAEHEYLYWEFYEGARAAQAVRMGDWKAIRKPMFTGGIELFHLGDDLGESRNVASKHPDLVARARAIMAEAHVPSDLWKPAETRPDRPGRPEATEPRADAAPARRPNVVLLMTDDQGYGDLRCLGNTMIETPNLDRLHGQSVRLTDFHVDPTCSPTRSALMTGRYSSRTGVWHTIMGRSILRRDEVTMADAFAANGYRTGIFGKWHLGDNYPYRPQDRGFQASLVIRGGGDGQTPDYWGNDYFDDVFVRDGARQTQQGYCTDVFFRAARDFIAANAKEDRPFFCYIPTNAPHSPYNVAEKYSKPYRDKGVPEPMANFYGMITNIDENVGALLADIDRLGLADDTIFIFLTDNGSAAGTARPGRARGTDRGAWTGFDAGMRGAKGSEYEGGHRVPIFFRWPGKLPAGRDVDTLTAHVDVLPTLVELCGLDRPNQAALDGRSLVGPLTGKGTIPDRTLFVHSQRIEHPEKWRKSAVMTERWRLVNGEELYDIQADPGQEHDIASQHPDAVQALRRSYDGWWQGLSSRFDEYCRIVVGSDHENPTHLCCHDWHGEPAPSSQDQVEERVVANGFWALDVDHDGPYDITLRERPYEARFPIEAATARLRIGDSEQSKPVPNGASGVTFRAHLKPGPAQLETWLDGTDGKTRGAYYVEIRRLP